MPKSKNKSGVKAAKAYEQKKKAERDAGRPVAQAVLQPGLAGTAAAAGAELPRGSKRTAEEGTALARKLQKLAHGDRIMNADEFREANEIMVVAKSAPDPFQTFKEAESLFGTALSAALRKQGYEKPTPIQAQAWPIALREYDVVAVAETGSGKTCAFILPALVHLRKHGPGKSTGIKALESAMPRVLVVAPTRELVQQIGKETQKFAREVNARTVTIFGGVAKTEQVKQLKKGCDILISTSGRLLDFMRPFQGMDPSVSVESVSFLILDEADKMLDMGFEPDIYTIQSRCKPSGTAAEVHQGKARQTCFFTATWPQQVHRAAERFTSHKAVQVRIGQGNEGKELRANSAVDQTVMVMEEEEKLSHLKTVLAKDLQVGETCIIFCMKKYICDRLSDQLAQAVSETETGWVKTLHSGKGQRERDGILNEFRRMTTDPKNTKKAALVATDVASRGLDIPGVALVVVYDFSNQNTTNAESYVHRIGRTGRAGKGGRSVCFITKEDRDVGMLVKILQDTQQTVPPELADLAGKRVGRRDARSAKTKRREKERKRKREKERAKMEKKMAKAKAKGAGTSKGTGKGKDKPALSRRQKSKLKKPVR